MNAHTTTVKAIDWNHVLRVTLRATWWLLKALFKLAVLLGSVVVAIIVGVINKNDGKKNDSDLSDNDLYARDGLSYTSSNRLQNSHWADNE